MIEENGESTVVKSPSSEFDSIISKVHKKNSMVSETRQLQNQVQSCLLTMANYQISEHPKTEDAFFIMLRNHSLPNADIITACLLRLLPEPTMSWLSNNPWRPVLVSFFDVQLVGSIYTEQSISLELMGHEKIERLTKIVLDQEKYLEEALQLLTSLDRAGSQRQRLMQALNSKIGRVILRPFLLTDIESRLAEIYELTQDYLSRRNDADVVDLAVEFTGVTENLIDDLNSFGTIYGQLIKEQICEKLQHFIEIDLSGNKAAEPAEILITVPNRKYPIEDIGSLFNVELIVNNKGPGYAFDVVLCGVGDGITVQENDVKIGRMLPGKGQLVHLPAKLLYNKIPPALLVECRWQNYNKELKQVEFTTKLVSQKQGIKWEQLQRKDPYSLLPVDSENELIGRKEILNRLLSVVTAEKQGSCIIRGQKRVGKTSIAKALQSHLERLNYIVVYLDSGDFVSPKAVDSIAKLGVKLATTITKLDSRLSHIPIPKFTDAISPLADFLDEVIASTPDRRIIIVLDEFDWLPFDTYRGVLGDAFFLSLRSISARPNVSFVIVGGEKMTRVMEYQGMQLNRWASVYVDYFSRETDWSDYRELIQRPTSDILEFTEDAIISLHNTTAGNPYFTKLVCQTIFQQAVNRHDSFVSETEVEKAIEITVGANKTDVNTFAHFWDDSIFEEDERAREDKSVRRRKILIAVSDVLHLQYPASRKKISEHEFAFSIPQLDSDLDEFTSRGILVTLKKGDNYDFKVPLFHMWLQRKGVFDIIAQIHDLDGIMSERKKLEEIKIRPEEIIQLARKWGTYRGQVITEEKIRAWLNQFETIKEQRSMFILLEGLRFYSEGFARKKMLEAHAIVRMDLTQHLGSAKRSDILVSYADGVGKSGAFFARLYADEVPIYVGNVIEKSQLAATLKARDDIQAVVFIDDFVGTGQSAIGYLTGLHSELAEIIQHKNIKLVFITLVACLEGWAKLQTSLDKLIPKMFVHACEILDNTAECFNESSTMYPSVSERIFAKETAQKYGMRLEKTRPLGFGNLQMAVVFEYGCPNNSLPILWKESSKAKWVPLFKRS